MAKAVKKHKAPRLPAPPAATIPPELRIPPGLRDSVLELEAQLEQLKERFGPEARAKAAAEDAEIKRQGDAIGRALAIRDGLLPPPWLNKPPAQRPDDEPAAPVRLPPGLQGRQAGHILERLPENWEQLGAWDLRRETEKNFKDDRSAPHDRTFRKVVPLILVHREIVRRYLAQRKPK